MSYKVTVHNKYKDGSELRLAFDTASILLHVASEEAKIEVMTARMQKQQNWLETPVFSKVTFKPVRT